MATATAFMKCSRNLAAGLRFERDGRGRRVPDPDRRGASCQARQCVPATNPGVGGRDETERPGGGRRRVVAVPGMAAAGRTVSSGRLPIAVGQETIAHEI